MKMANEYLNKQQFEHDLINRRLTWLLTSQSILFAALALALGNDVVENHRATFMLILPLLGIVISAFTFLGVLMGVIAKYTNWQDELKAQQKRKANAEQNGEEFIEEPVDWGVRAWITRGAITTDLAIPLAFLGAWIWALCRF